MIKRKAEFTRKMKDDLKRLRDGGIHSNPIPLANDFLMLAENLTAKQAMDLGIGITLRVCLFAMIKDEGDPSILELESLHDAVEKKMLDRLEALRCISKKEVLT